MNTAQRVIKYCAIAFAILLIGGIITAIISVVAALGYVFGSWDGDSASISDVTEVVEIGEVSERNLTSLHIDVKATNVVIERGSEFTVEANEDVLQISRGGNALYVQEKDFSWLKDWDTRGGELKIVLPESWDSLETLRLNAGAGRAELRDLKVHNLELELGAGKTEISNVTATERTKINGGAGYLAVHESELKDLDLDMGVGKVELDVKLTGNTQIDAGVGKLELNLRGTLAEYRVKIEKGLGTITLNGEKLSDGAVRGDGEHLVDIDGGVGAIEINVL